MIIDASDFTALARDLGGLARADLVDKVRPVVGKAANNVKKAMVADMAASEHFGQVAPSIGYDLVDSRQVSEALIGPATGGKVVGDLAHIAYFGGTRGGGGTVRDPEVHLEEEASRFETAVGDVLDEFLS